MYTLTINTAITGDGPGLTGIATTQSDAVDKRQVELPANSTNKEVDITIDVSALKGIVLLADAAVTVKSNSSTEPDDNFDLGAGRDLSWITGQGDAPFSADVTKLYLTSEAGGNVNIWVYKDSTPE
jgi:hypothetical protein